MEKRRSELEREQPDLFRPALTSPEWRTLPEEARRRAVELLSRLMRESAAGRRQEADGE